MVTYAGQFPWPKAQPTDFDEAHLMQNPMALHHSSHTLLDAAIVIDHWIIYSTALTFKSPTLLCTSQLWCSHGSHSSWCLLGWHNSWHMATNRLTPTISFLQADDLCQKQLIKMHTPKSMLSSQFSSVWFPLNIFFYFLVPLVPPYPHPSIECVQLNHAHCSWLVAHACSSCLTVAPYKKYSHIQTDAKRAFQ